MGFDITSKTEELDNIKSDPQLAAEELVSFNPYAQAGPAASFCSWLRALTDDGTKVLDEHRFKLAVLSYNRVSVDDRADVARELSGRFPWLSFIVTADFAGYDKMVSSGA